MYEKDRKRLSRAPKDREGWDNYDVEMRRGCLDLDLTAVPTVLHCSPSPKPSHLTS